MKMILHSKHLFFYVIQFLACVYHEQSRPDRDSYVKIHWENISPGLHYNFFKAKKENVDSLGTPYDYRYVLYLNVSVEKKGRFWVTAPSTSAPSTLQY